MDRYCITRDVGTKYRVYDNDLKRFAEPADKASSKADARERARLLNSQQSLHDQMYGPVFVTADLVTASDVYGRFIAEASTLRIPPGDIPNSLRTDLGNSQPLFYTGMRPGGTLVYKQLAGCIELHVLND